MWPTSNNAASQWSFNPAVYQNIPYEQVDWASLAQQWIKMKETVPNVSPGPPPPPAPQISKKAEPIPTKPTTTAAAAATESQYVNDIEGGEAPMDMDTKDDEAATPPIGVNPGTNWNQWNNWQSQWGWGWPENSGTVPLGEKTQSSASTVDSKVKSPNNDSIPVLNNYVSNVGNLPAIGNSSGTSASQIPGSFNYNNIAGGMIPPVLPKPGYWSDNAYSAPGKFPMDSWNKGNKLNRSGNKAQAVPQQFVDLDAAKKKKLPAWIREGLNKMEREKQKKLEQERMALEKHKYDDIYQDQLQENDLPSDNHQSLVQHSPVVEDDLEDSSPGLQYQRQSSPPVSPERASRLQQQQQQQQQQRASRIIQEDTHAIRKTKDQIMEESMLKVRRILTQLLLEATESHVQLIAKEELRKRKSASVQQARRNNALTSLTGNLGLDVYDSDSQSSDTDKEKEDGVDSDEELQLLIEKKKRDFTLIEDQIEDEIESHELRERKMAQQDNEDDDDDDDEDSSDMKVNNDRVNRENHRSHDTVNKRDRKNLSDRGATTLLNNNKSNDRVDTNNSSSLNHVNKVDKIDGEKANDKTKPRRPEKSKQTTRSSSLSTSSTSSSSSSTSSYSDSSSESGNSSSSGHHRKRKRKRRTRERSEKDRDSSKRSRYRSRSRSTSRSRHSRDDRSIKSSQSHESERKRASTTHRRGSPSRRRRSPSYHKDSRDRGSRRRDSGDSRSSRRRDSGDSRSSRRDSRSRDSRHPRYRRH